MFNVICCREREIIGIRWLDIERRKPDTALLAAESGESFGSLNAIILHEKQVDEESCRRVCNAKGYK